MAAIDSVVSRKAEDGGVVGRLWAAKAARMTSAASSASAIVRARTTIGSVWDGARSAPGKERTMAVRPYTSVARRGKTADGAKALDMG